jgi:hypothetical protein
MSLRIIRYIHGELNDVEKKAFEEELKINSKLKAEYDGFVTKVNLEDEVFFEKLDEKKKVIPFNKLWYKGMAAIVCIMFTSLFLKVYDPSEGELLKAKGEVRATSLIEYSYQGDDLIKVIVDLSGVNEKQLLNVELNYGTEVKYQPSVEFQKDSDLVIDGSDLKGLNSIRLLLTSKVISDSSKLKACFNNVEICNGELYVK